MELIQKILLATDFGKASQDALLMTVRLAETFHAQVILIHVIPEIGRPPALGKDTRKMAAEKLKELGADLRSRGVSSVKVIVSSGIPFERIIEHSEKLDVNLIVLGSGEQKEGFPLGITAERVMTYADKPVFVVKLGARPDINRILCPVDFSEPSRRALKEAIYLSLFFHAHLSVLTVFKPFLSSYFGKGKTPGESHEKLLTEQQESEFKRFLREFDLGGVKSSNTIRRGEAHREILDSILSMESDLLIIGARGRTGLTRIFLGSTTEKVVREVPCSVIVLKQEHAIRSHIVSEINEIERQFSKGKQKLEEELFDEAFYHFEYCTRKNLLFAPAWQGMALACKSLGQEKEARRYREMAVYIRRFLDERI